MDRIRSGIMFFTKKFVEKIGILEHLDKAFKRKLIEDLNVETLMVKVII